MASGRDDQPGDRVRAVRGRLHGPRRRDRHHDRRRRLAVRHRGRPRPTRPAAAGLHRRGPGRPRQGGRHAGRATGSCRSTARRSRTGTTCGTAIRRNGGRRGHDRRRCGTAGDVTAAHQHHRRRQASTPTTRERITKAGFLGVSPTVVNERQGPGYVVTTMATGTWADRARRSAPCRVKLYHVGRAALGLEKRDVERPDERRRRRPGRRRDAVGQRRRSASRPVLLVLLLLAGLNLFLGMFNLVPLLPLDGGQIAGALYEAARRGGGPAAAPPRPRLRRQSPSCCRSPT